MSFLNSSGGKKCASKLVKSHYLDLNTINELKKTNHKPDKTHKNSVSSLIISILINSNGINRINFIQQTTMFYQ